MPDAILIATTKAVVEALNVGVAIPGTFAKDFEAERSYADWDLPLGENEDTDPDTVFVDVVPAPPVELDIETRSTILRSPAVDIVVRKRLTPANRDLSSKLTLADVDELVLLVEQLGDFFIGETLSNGARWKASSIPRAYVPSHLRQNCGQFTGQIRVTFEISNAI